MTDYRILLLKYIAWVKDQEGVDFITEGGMPYRSAVQFTAEEKAELEQLAKAAESENA